MPVVTSPASGARYARDTPSTPGIDRTRSAS
jgi:hypothetical protein